MVNDEPQVLHIYSRPNEGASITYGIARLGRRVYVGVVFHCKLCPTSTTGPVTDDTLAKFLAHVCRPGRS